MRSEEGLGSAFFGAAVLLATSSVLAPYSVYIRIERSVEWIARNLERFVSWALMSLIFYWVFAPLGMLFRSAGRDSLQRKLEPHRKTYWNDRSNQPFTVESRRRLY